MKVYEFDSLPSTNDFADSLPSGSEDIYIIAKRQTDGHGTKGRSFLSAEGGLYLTKLSFPENLPASAAFLIMASTAMAVVKTLEEFSLAPKIKWPNDILVNGKKICGILIKNTLSGEKVSRSMVGIGLNIFNEFPEELSSIAINMAEAGGKNLSFSAVKNALVSALQKEYSLEEYERYLCVLGKKVFLLEGEEKKEVFAQSLTEDGRLKVNENGEVRLVSAGEVSLRLLKEVPDEGKEIL